MPRHSTAGGNFGGRLHREGPRCSFQMAALLLWCKKSDCAVAPRATLPPERHAAERASSLRPSSADAFTGPRARPTPPTGGEPHPRCSSRWSWTPACTCGHICAQNGTASDNPLAARGRRLCSPLAGFNSSAPGQAAPAPERAQSIEIDRQAKGQAPHLSKYLPLTAATSGEAAR